MQRVINNTFTLTAYSGSKTYVTYLTLDKGMLHQFYNRDGNGGAGSVSPNWETSIKDQPKFHAECHTTDGDPVKIELNDNLKLYYNNTEVLFDSDTKSSTAPIAGMFKYEDDKEKGVRYYSIIKNVASAGNEDNDYIRIEGQILTEGNNVENIKSPTATIQIIPVASGGTAYIMQIDAPAIKNGEKSTKLTAKIFESNGNTEVTAKSYLWKRLDGKNYNEVGKQDTLTVNDTDVSGFELYTCEATIGTINVTAACSVFDYNDNLYFDFQITGVGNPNNVRKSETAKIKAIIVDKDGKEVNLADTAFSDMSIQFTLLDKAGKDVNRIKSNEITLTYNDIISNYGGRVTGYATLEKQQN